MRALEILLLLGLGLALVGCFPSAAKRASWLRWLPATAALLALLQVGIEGARWQLVPAYLLTAVVGLSALVRPLPRSLAALGIVFVLLSAALAAALPVFELPEPTGPYRVGTARFQLVDASRGEPFSADPDQRRELLVEAWYPAEAGEGGTPAPYLPEAPLVFPQLFQFLADAPRLAGSDPLSEPASEWTPTFLFNHLEWVQSHAYRDAPPSPSGPAYPVLIFSHGYLGGHVRQNTILMEHLASHGYAIFSIGHTHETMLSIAADGRVVPLDYRNPLLRPQLEAVLAQNSPVGRSLMAEMVAAPTPAERDRLLRVYLNGTVASWYGRSGRIWLDDTRFVLAEIDKLNAAGRFAGRLDTSRIALLGMSFGGKIVARFCAQEERCVAGVDLDGGLPLLASLDHPPTQPMLVFYPIEKEQRYRLFYDRLQGPVYRVALHRASHEHFMEIALVTNPLGRLESLDAYLALEIVNDYTLAFLDQHVRGAPSSLLAGASPYPEAVFSARQEPAPLP